MTRAASLAALAALLSALPAAAQQPPASSWIAPAKGAEKPPEKAGAKTAPAAPTSLPAPASAPAPKPPPPPAPGDDFDLLAPAPALDAAAMARAQELEAKLATRRKLLGLHQVAGFVNLAALTTAVVLGQLDYSDKYGGGGDTGKWITPHAAAAYGAAGIFAATGLLALLAPSPIDQPLRLSNATVHKTCMAVATAGMVAQVVLGVVAAAREGKVVQRDWALAHQIVGYGTAAATAGGFVAITW